MSAAAGASTNGPGNAAEVPGNRLCPAYGSSQRGLAHNALDDTFFSGSFADGIIHQFDSEGVLLRSVDVDLPIIGLAFNPATDEIVASLSTAAANAELVVLDSSDFSVVRSLDVAVPAGYRLDGIGLACDGTLWQGTQTRNVLHLDIGMDPWCDVFDISWLDLGQTTVSIPAGGSVDVPVTIDASALARGQYEAQVRVASTGPDDIQMTPVTIGVADLPSPPQNAAATATTATATR